MSQSHTGRKVSEEQLRRLLKKTRCSKCRVYIGNNFFRSEELSKEKPICIQCKKLNTKKERNCLRCGKKFMSSGNHNRVCCRAGLEAQYMDMWEK